MKALNVAIKIMNNKEVEEAIELKLIPKANYILPDNGAVFYDKNNEGERGCFDLVAYIPNEEKVRFYMVSFKDMPKDNISMWGWLLNCHDDVNTMTDEELIKRWM